MEETKGQTVKQFAKEARELTEYLLLTVYPNAFKDIPIIEGLLPYIEEAVTESPSNALNAISNLHKEIGRFKEKWQNKL